MVCQCGAILKDVDGSVGTSLMAFIVLWYRVPGGMANGHLGQSGYFFPHPNTQIYLFIFTYSSGIAWLYERHLPSEMWAIWKSLTLHVFALVDYFHIWLFFFFHPTSASLGGGVNLIIFSIFLWPLLLDILISTDERTGEVKTDAKQTDNFVIGLLLSYCSWSKS